MKTAVLIPIYNESKTIKSVVQALKAKKLDVIVIDDGSKDDGGSLAASAGAVVLRNEPNQGKGYSLKRGFAYLLEKGFDGVVMMDGDAQHDVDDLPQFLELANKYPDSVISGNRMANAQGMPMVRYATNCFMSWMISLACRQKIEDTQCGYRYVGANVLRNLKLISGDFEIETEILMKASKRGYKVFNVPIKTIYRDEVSHIHPVKDTIRFIRYFIKELFTPA